MSTLPMTTGNTDFMIERMGEDCGPLQYVRELTQNAIEAIQKTGRSDGQVVWSYQVVEGTKKLCITDNGCGMTKDEMVLYLNSLSSSGQRQGLDANFGVGAKISAVVKNPHGLRYMSWKDNQGHMLCLWKDPEAGAYGIKQLVRNGSVFHVAPITTRPSDLIQDSGTHIILEGKDADDDTYSKCSDVTDRNKEGWLLKYLNTRYFEIPQNITIRCNVTSKSTTGLRIVTGQKRMLDEISRAGGLSSGVVALDGALAHWWLVPPAKARLERPAEVTKGYSVNTMETLNPTHYATGHVAVLFQNELYDMRRGPAGRALLQQFGMLFGTDQLVVYIEPAGALANTARTSVIINGQPPPFQEWADQFRAKLPQELIDFQEKLEPSKTDSKKVDERIKSVMYMFNVSKYRATPKGDLTISPPSSAGKMPTENEVEEEAQSSPDQKPPKKSKSTPKRDPFADLISDNGEPGTSVCPPIDLPEVFWVTKANGTRQDHDDDAAWFVRPNKIMINADFAGFLSLVEMFAGKYSSVAAKEVRLVIEQWWEQQLKEAVHGIRSLGAAKLWTQERIDKALQEPDTLTASVSTRYLLVSAIKRELGSRLGSYETAA